MGNLVDINGKYKSWDTMKYEYNLTDKETFRWVQQVHAIPKFWVEALNKDSRLSVNLAIYDHNLIKICQFYTLDKLVLRNYTTFHFAQCTKNLHQKYLNQQI